MKNSAFILLLTILGAPAFAEFQASTSKISDLAALSIQDKSIKKLESLIRQYAGTTREAELLSRLADLYLERSGLSFQISEGVSIKNKSPLYANSLKEAVRVLTHLLKDYPTHPLANAAHFKRGKAYKEMDQVAHAREDYLFLNKNAPDYEYLDSALIDLADFAQDENHHEEALTYLAQIEKMPFSNFHPIALHKAAWSYFNLGKYEPAIAYLKKEVDFYYVKIDQTKGDGTAESAFLESAFNDLSLFYFEALNKKSSFATVDDGLETFKKFDTHQKFFGSTVFKFAKLLKAYTLLPELDQLRKRLTKNEQKLPETAEVVLLLFQFHFDRHDFNNLTPLLSDLKDIRNEKNQPRLEQILSNALSDLHKLVIKNKLATERAVLVKPLINLTESVNDLFGKQNTTALMANYALAETLFELGEFSQSTAYYQNLLKPEYQLTLDAKKLNHSTLTLRLLSSRYKEFQKDELIPQKVKTLSLTAKIETATKEQLSRMTEWVSWLDAANLEIRPIEDKPSYDAFSLEAAKLVYLYFDREKAVARLTQYGLTHADVGEGTTALSLALDTFAESKDNARLYELTQQISALPKNKNKEFVAKVKDMGANAHLNITLGSKDAVVRLARSAECIKNFTDAKVVLECKTIHAKTLTETNKYEPAVKEISELLGLAKDETHQKSLLLLRADARNHLGQTAEAVVDLNRYQVLTNYSDPEITEQILQYAWFKNDAAMLKGLLNNPKVCQGKNESHCDQYKVVKILEDGNYSLKYLTAFKNTIKAEKEVQAVWALYSLHEPKKLPFQDRLILLQRLAHSWENLNPLLQIHLFPKMVSSVTETFESIRISAPGIAPLTSDTASIERRMRMMQEIDQTFAKVMKLNWLTIKRSGAIELGIIYTRLVDDLRSIHTPEELLKPFIQKSAEIKTAIRNLEGMAIVFQPTNRVPGSVETTPETLLTSPEVKAQVPANLWADWVRGVKLKRRDYLFHLVGILETTQPEAKAIGPLLKGLVLLFGNAPSEAFALIEAAPESPWKTTLITQFQRSKQ